MLHPAEREGGMNDQFSLKHKTPLSFELRGFYLFMACLFKGWGPAFNPMPSSCNLQQILPHLLVDSTADDHVIDLLEIHFFLEILFGFRVVPFVIRN